MAYTSRKHIPACDFSTNLSRLTDIMQTFIEASNATYPNAPVVNQHSIWYDWAKKYHVFEKRVKN